MEIYKPVLLPEDGQQKREILTPEDDDQIQLPTNEEITAELQQEDIPLDLEPSPDNADHWVRRSTRLRHPTQRYDPSLHQILLTDEGEPLPLKESRTCEHSNKWEVAMQEEIKALHQNNTWEFVELPKGKKAIPNKWVYKVKTLEGKPKYKARLLAKGYRQIQ